MSERVAGLLFKIRADITSLREGMKQANTAVTGLQKTITGLAGAMGIAFGAYTIKQAGEFVISLVKLGGEVRGIKDAFDKLNQPGLLDKLKKATRGIIDDTDLMKSAIKAENFAIPLKNLALYFEFATKRATQTGESVQDLIDIIVNGIGKQSMKVVKGIGLSVDEWKKIFKETGDFAQTATIMMTKQIEKMGTVTKTEAQNIQSIGTSWQNVKEQVGLVITGKGGINDALNTFALTLNGVAEVIPKVNTFLGDTGLRLRDIFKLLRLDFASAFASLIKSQIKEAFGDVIKIYWEEFKNFQLSTRAIFKQPFTTEKSYQKATLNAGGISRSALSPVPYMGSELLPESLGKPKYTEHIANISGWDQFLDTEGYKDAVKKIEESTKHFTTIFQGAGESITEDVFKMSDAIRDSFSFMAETIGNAIESAFAGESAKDIGKEALQSMGKFMRQMGAMMLAYGLAAKYFRSALINPNALIIAGAAMIAIGSAISGLAQRGVSGAGGGGGSYMQTRHSGVSLNIKTESIVKGNDIYFVNKRFGRYHDLVT